MRIYLLLTWKIKRNSLRKLRIVLRKVLESFKFSLWKCKTALVIGVLFLFHIANGHVATYDLNGVNTTLTDTDSALFGQDFTNSTGTATLALNFSSDETLSGNLTDNGGGSLSTLSLTIEGGKILTLSGASNTYSGGTTVLSGTFILAAGSAAGSGAITLSSGTTLHAMGLTVMSNDIILG